jgi:hypothetical protein
VQRLDHISQQLSEANEMMKHAVKQLEEGNQRAATLERAAKMLLPNLDKKDGAKQSGVNEPAPLGLETMPAACSDKWPRRDGDDASEIAAFEPRQLK